MQVLRCQGGHCVVFQTVFPYVTREFNVFFNFGFHVEPASQFYVSQI